VPAIAKAEFDLGEAPASTQLSHVRILLSRTAAQQAALDKYMASLQDKSSPNYHKWLTPDQFGKLYGPADSDIAAIVAWLESHGLKVDEVSSGRTNIAFSGTVRQVEEALHTSIHSYNANGEQFLSNTSEPAIPAALAPVIAGVARLNTIRPRPHHLTGRPGTYDQSAGKFVPQSRPVNGLSGARPAYTGGSGTTSDPYTLFLVAGDAATIYNTPNAFNANFSSGTSYTGTGVTIGIVGDAVIQPTTVANYWVAFLGQTATNAAARLTITNVDGVTATDDTDEAYIDTELAGGLAPDASIHFYTGTSLDVGIEQLLRDNSVDIFSLSFGLCEGFLTSTDNSLINSAWQQAAAQGIAVTVSTGDNGSAGCDNTTYFTADYGLSVNGYASTPYNVAVGGTDFDGLLSGFTNYVGTTNTGGAPTYYRTAMKYIPEATWNDSVVTDGLLSANVPLLDINGNSNIFAGSGGPSNCSINSTTASVIGTCAGGYPKPAWQRGSGVPVDGARDLPDISLMSGAGADNASWLVCTDGSIKNSSGVTVTTDCSTQSDGHFYFLGFGGTSTAAPAFAGMLALLQQETGSRLASGVVSGLYDLYNSSTYASAVFHDVNIGNNAVPCDSGTPNCALNTAGNDFLTGYDTSAGYDLATGIGSVDATQLINSWGKATVAGVPTVTATPSATTISSSTGLHVAVTVTGTAGTPTGSVVLQGSAFTPITQTLAAGAANFSVPAGTLNVGANPLTVNYSGDSSYQPASSSSFTVTVTGLTPTVTVTPSKNSLLASDAITVQATVTGTGATPTGKVTLFGQGVFAAAQQLSNGSYTFTIPADSLYGGNNQSLTVSYSGNADYASATGSANISVTPVYALSATAPAPITAGGTATSTITVSSVSGYVGTVNLSCALTSSPAGATSPPTCSTSGSVALTTSNTQCHLIPGTGTILCSGTATVTIGTTANAALEPPRLFPWQVAGGGVVLTLVIFLGAPPKRRRWLSILGVLTVTITLSSMWACSSTSGGGGGGKTTPSVVVTPAKTSIQVPDSLAVAVAVSGGTSTPTGSVTLTGGSYNSGAVNLASGAANIKIPGNSLAVGTATLNAAYSGDSNFNSASGTASVTVSNPGTTAGTYTFTVTGTGSPVLTPAPTATITLTVN
jgi:subtilase family serine protease